MSTLRNLARITIVLCIAGVAVTGCGRKGNLDKPSTPIEKQNIRKSGQQQEPTVDRPFVLDPLL
ncbi:MULTISPECIES: LPS translocon maturation chaperone LptM [unclassified Rhizobium]|jgi:predicted small lipoprotein YifL|uniref:LPS translocon maturation chaperone LptM n=1 Tax=unclassified Rhizobium TaxID=2613769 RepID=UPI003D29FD9F